MISVSRNLAVFIEESTLYMLLTSMHYIECVVADSPPLLIPKVR